MPHATDPTDFGAFLKRKIEKDASLAIAVDIAKSDLRIAEEIYKRRKAKGMTQSSLAKAIGTSQSVIARLEDADYSKYSVRTLQRIAAALDAELGVRFVDKFDSIEINEQYSAPVEEWPEPVPTSFKKQHTHGEEKNHK